MYRGVHLWLQCLSYEGPNMTAVKVWMGSIYDCNVGHVEFKICLQSWLQKGSNISAIFSGCQHDQDCSHIWPLTWQILQS